MTKINIKPKFDRVVILPDPAESKTAGGIIIPDMAKEKPKTGTVLAVGPGKKDEPMTLKIGEKVMYGHHSGVEIVVNGKDYLIMTEGEILAVI